MHESVELVLSHYDGSNVEAMTRFSADRGGGPLPRKKVALSRQALSFDACEAYLRLGRPNEFIAEGQALITKLGIGESIKATTRVVLHITESAAYLRRLPWEALFRRLAPESKRCLVYRFAEAEGRPRPRRMNRPSFICMATFDEKAPEVAGDNNILNLTDLTRDAMRVTLASTTSKSPSDVMVACVARALSQDEALVLYVQKEKKSRTEPLSSVLRLRDEQGLLPQGVILLLRPMESLARMSKDSFGGTAYVAAQQLVAAGVPLVAIVTNVTASAQVIRKRLASLKSRLAETDAQSLDAVELLHSELTKELSGDELEADPASPRRLSEDEPVLVTSYRSGVLWPRRSITELAAPLRDFRQHCVVVGPLAHATEGRWLRAPLDILTDYVCLPLYEEHLQNGLSIGSYVQAFLKNSDATRAMYFLCWIDVLLQLIEKSSRAKTKVESWQRGESAPASKEDDKWRPMLNADQRSWAREFLLACCETKELQAEDRRRLSMLVDKGKPVPVTFADACRVIWGCSESFMNKLLKLFRPGQEDGEQNEMARELLENTSWWKLAQIRAKTYISADPMPFLEYALALQESAPPVRTNYFTVSGQFPKMQISAASPPKSLPVDAPATKLIYLCGCVLDPQTVLLSEEALVEHLFLKRERWFDLLKEIGDCVGLNTNTLFLGFSPEDAVFRQLMQSLFRASLVNGRVQMIVAPRPDEGFFSYPEEGERFLKAQLEETIPMLQHRMRRLEGEVDSEPPDDRIKLCWGTPEDAIQEILNALAAQTKP